MNNNDIISSIYQIIETREYFEAEKLFLVKNINNNNQYWLQYIDLKNRSDSDIELIKNKINIIKQIADNERFAKLIEIKEEENTFTLVYEKIAGINLADYPSNSEAEIIKQIKYVLESLKIIHDQGFVHQMINPKNMIIAPPHNHLIINNYGKITNDLYSALMATISVEDTVYITQEQLRGQASFSSDIYALGIVTINSIMGINVLDLDENDSGLLNWSKGKNYTDKFTSIINKMINSQINQRYRNVEEVLGDIVRYFPETTNSDNLQHSPDYTPTEIIFSETDTIQEAIYSSEPVLKSTQASQADEYFSESENTILVNEDSKTILVNENSNMPATEAAPTSEQEREENEEDINLLTQNTHLETSFFGADSTKIEPKSQSDQALESPNHDTSPQPSPSPINRSWFNLIKTPQGILGIVVVSLIAVFGINTFNNKLEEKKVKFIIGIILFNIVC